MAESSRKPVALVTGSGKRRIGSFVAEALAERGYHVVVHYYRSAEEAAQTVERLRGHGVESVALAADLADEAQAQRLVDETLERFGRIDALVTCAAVWEEKRLEDTTPADVRRHFEINTLASFVCAQKAGVAMVAQEEGGAIVLVGDWAVRRPYLDYAAYFVSKGAIATMTRMLAVELGTRNHRVRVNCVEPGPVMMKEDLPQAVREAAVEATLVKREGRGEDVARAVVFLVENSFVTGVCLPVDGGRGVFARG